MAASPSKRTARPRPRARSPMPWPRRAAFGVQDGRRVSGFHALGRGRGWRDPRQPSAPAARYVSPACRPTHAGDRQKAIRPMSQDQVSAFLTAVQQDARHYPLFLLLARTGLRPAEAFGLHWDDLDFRAREL